MNSQRGVWWARLDRQSERLDRAHEVLCICREHGLSQSLALRVYQGQVREFAALTAATPIEVLLEYASQGHGPRHV